MKNKFLNNFNKNYLKHLFPQRTRLTTEYSLSEDSGHDKVCDAIDLMIQKDYDQVKDYLPEACENVLDIGCGLGLSNIPVYQRYEGCAVHLLDKSEDEQEGQKIRGFNEVYGFYNSMDGAVATLMSNNVSGADIFCYEVGDHDHLYDQEFDLITSFLSCGWHYPVKTYVDLIKKTLRPSGVLVLDLRHDTGELEYAQEHFELVKHIVNNNESKHTGGTIGDRYIFKNG